MRRVTTVLIAAVALLGVAAAGLVAAGCGGSSVPSDAVATVGDATVPRTDFQRLMDQAQTQMKAQGMAVPKKGSDSYDHFTGQIVKYLVEEQIVTQSSKELGVQITDQEVSDQIAQLEQAYGGEKKVLALLKEQGMTLDLLKRSIRSQTLSSRAAEVVTKKATISDAEIQAYWDAHKAELAKSKKTATLAKARTTVKQTLLSAKQQQLWAAWILERSKVLGVQYAAGYDPSALSASASASASPAG